MSILDEIGAKLGANMDKAKLCRACGGPRSDNPDYGESEGVMVWIGGPRFNGDYATVSMDTLDYTLSAEVARAVFGIDEGDGAKFVITRIDEGEG